MASKTQIDWDQVNKINFIIVVMFGLLFIVATWTPAIFRDQIFGRYTPGQIANIRTAVTIMMCIGTAALIALICWNLRQFVERTQILVDDKLRRKQHIINAVIIFCEITILAVIAIQTIRYTMGTIVIVPVIPVVLSLIFWIICAFIKLNHK